MNREVIAIDQDILGKQGDRIFTEGPMEMWARPLADGSEALALFNFGRDRADMRDIQFPLASLGFARSAHARDVWNGKDLGSIEKDRHFTIPPHGVILLRLSQTAMR